MIFRLLVLSTALSVVSLTEIDSNGYLAYCPCMGKFFAEIFCTFLRKCFITDIHYLYISIGRFGNQADHFLGSLNFAKALNRTLILPPWIEYRQGELKSIQVAFDRYFQVEPIRQFHRVITMHEFMETIADSIWPVDMRRSFCYMERKSLSGSKKKICHAKEGNPFGPFWDEFNIDFVGSEFFSPLHYDAWHTPDLIDKWHHKYPASEWPVIAFTGAPASFPVQAENIPLQKYLVWTNEMQTKATEWVKSTLPKGAYLGIHLRNGVDWKRACEHITDSPNLFSAAQCLGYRNEQGIATKDMCLPTKDLIIKQIKREIKTHHSKHPNNAIKSIFVASDNDYMINELNDALKRLKITSYRMREKNPHFDLIILEKSNLFIGNCISSFSAFVIRSRNVRGFPSAFWAFEDPSNISKKKVESTTHARDEL